MDRITGLHALRTPLVLALVIGFAAPLVHAEIIGGESWTSDLRVRTVAEETSKGKWNLELRVFDRSTDRPVLYRSLVTYSNRTRELSIQGLDRREYRFVIMVRDSALEASLEIRENGEAIDYLRTIYETERRRQLAETADTTGSNILRVGGRVLAPELIHRTPPHYPAEAKAYRVSGVVIVEATIDETGRVRRTRVVKGLPFGLSEAAAEAVESWRFNPATMDGEPVSVAYNVSVEFNLHRSGD